jgi:hypothetical protein
MLYIANIKTATKEEKKMKEESRSKTWHQWNTQKAFLWWRTQSKQPQHHKAPRSHELS